MTSNQLQVITTGVDAAERATYDRVWNIENFDLIMENIELVANEKMIIKTGNGSSSRCTFLVKLSVRDSLKTTFNEDVVVSCQLYKMEGVLGETIGVTFRAQLLNREYVARKSSKLVLRSGLDFRLFSVSDFMQYLSADRTLAINISLTLSRHAVPKKVHQDHLAHLQKRSFSILHDNLVKLLFDGDSADVKIITSDGVELQAHKTILKMQNIVFASLLGSEFAESNTGVINVDDICGRTMKVILHFIYTGNLLPDWSHPDVVVEFTYGAGKYQLMDVLSMLDNTLGNENSQMYSSCYISLLSLANKLSLEKAAARLLRKIAGLAGSVESAENMMCLLNLN